MNRTTCLSSGIWINSQACRNNIMDNLDGNCIAKQKKEQDSNGTIDLETIQLPKGMALMSSNRDAMYYDMKHKTPGMAYIFNHQNFNSSIGKNRSGTDVDSEKLKHCFRRLNFDVHTFNDLKLAEIQDQIQRAVDMDHNNFDCFVMVVLSHGDVDTLCAKDEIYDPKTVIFDKFKSDKCKSLAGKPKLFFIQACQGSGLDSGIMLVDRKISRTETDGLRTPYRIPVLADFLIMYATSRGQYAFRNNVNGSFFITVLCEELVKLSRTENLLTILTIVMRRIAVEFQSSNTDNKEYHDRKQVPYFQSSLTRLVRFQMDPNTNNNIENKAEVEFISTKKI